MINKRGAFVLLCNFYLTCGTLFVFPESDSNLVRTETKPNVPYK